MIYGVDLTVYDDSGDEINIPLSPLQVQAVCKILGLKFENSNFLCYSDDGLKTVMDKTINRLREV